MRMTRIEADFTIIFEICQHPCQLRPTLFFSLRKNAILGNFFLFVLSNHKTGNKNQSILKLYDKSVSEKKMDDCFSIHILGNAISRIFKIRQFI
jgi:hypothetical protein